MAQDPVMPVSTRREGAQVTGAGQGQVEGRTLPVA